MTEPPPAILFVCLGNICRSPAAEGMFRNMARAAGLPVTTDSAGTGGLHRGEPPDPRMIRAAAHRGIDISDLRARQVDVGDFYVFDHILAMDGRNLTDLQDLAPRDGTAQLSKMLDFCTGGDVPDPYYGGAEGFDRVLTMLESACANLLNHIAKGQKCQLR